MFSPSPHSLSARPPVAISALALIFLAATLLLIASPASAQSAREIQIADYSLSFGPEAQRGADGRGDRNYLAQIRFQGLGRATRTEDRTTSARLRAPRASAALNAARDIARSEENSNFALRQVIAFESEQWKRASSGHMIADNYLAATSAERETPLDSVVAFGPQLPVGPIVSDLHSQLAHCKVDNPLTVTVARARASAPTQTDSPRLEVTQPQDRPAESC